jgi:hypothetical protein
LKVAANEWEILALPPKLAKYVSCECCGTRIKRTVRIHNGSTNSTLIIGLVCYGHLLSLFEKGHMPTSLTSRRAFLRRARIEFERELRQRYVGYYPGIDLKSWKVWFVERGVATRGVPTDVRLGIKELEEFGVVLSRHVLPALIRYHDQTRLFPRAVLLPEDWKRWAPEAREDPLESARREFTEETGPVIAGRFVPSSPARTWSDHGAATNRGGSRGLR